LSASLRGIPLHDGGNVHRAGICILVRRTTAANGSWKTTGRGSRLRLFRSDPDLVISGHDPQLEKAIELAEEALEENYKGPPPKAKVSPGQRIAARPLQDARSPSCRLGVSALYIERRTRQPSESTKHRSGQPKAGREDPSRKGFLPSRPKKCVRRGNYASFFRCLLESPLGVDSFSGHFWPLAGWGAKTHGWRRSNLWLKGLSAAGCLPSCLLTALRSPRVRVSPPCQPLRPGPPTGVLASGVRWHRHGLAMHISFFLHYGRRSCLR